MRSDCRNNPLNRVDPTGNFDILGFFKSLFAGFVGGLTFVLTGGDAALAGLAAGALSGAMSGKIENVVVGATIGGMTGGITAGVNAAYPGYGTYGGLAIGAGVADLPLYEMAAAYLPWKQGKWPGGVIAWGHTRVPIDIPGGAVVFGTPGIPPRSGFFIHGGWYPGSAGCINLGAHEKSFFDYFSAQRDAMPLTVDYGN